MAERDPWDVSRLGWKFGSESSALVALRGSLERSDASFQVGRNTLCDALREYSEVRAERDRLHAAAGDMLAALEKASRLYELALNTPDPNLAGLTNVLDLINAAVAPALAAARGGAA